MSNPPVIPARLQRAMADALTDTEQLAQRLDEARQAAASTERILRAAAESGLIAPGADLLEHVHMAASHAHAAAAASLKVVEDMNGLQR